MGLLEYWMRQCGFDYLSDLKYQKEWYSIITEMDNIDDYSIKEWQDAVSYLTEKHETCLETPSQARDYLIRCLNS